MRRRGSEVSNGRSAFVGRSDRLLKLQQDLKQLIREGIQKILCQAIENEAAEFVRQHDHLKDENGHLIVKRNGYLPERKIQTEIGAIAIRQPRVRGARFTSAILPRYSRKVLHSCSQGVTTYLREILRGDINAVLAAVLGERAKGLSATNLAGLTKVWEQAYGQWKSGDLSRGRYVRFLVDGIDSEVKSNHNHSCLLVILGTLVDGTKEVIAICEGEKGDRFSWGKCLQGLKARGLDHLPELEVGDENQAFWEALEEGFPGFSSQRCCTAMMGRSH